MSSSFAIDVAPALVDRLKHRDMAAFDEVYRLFERPAWTLAVRMLGDVEEAREVVHDAMLALYDKVRQFRGESPFWGWLRQVVVNEALMRLRKRRPDYVDELPEPEADTLTRHDTPVDADDLVRALGKLSPTTRSVVWLYVVEGYTHEEIANAFAKTASFSKTQLSRGMHRLREALAEVPEFAHA